MPPAKKAGHYEGHPAYRWVKMFKVRYYCYLGSGTNTERNTYLDLPRDMWTKDGSRAAANAWWTAKLAELTHNPVETAFRRVVESVPQTEIKKAIEGGIMARRIARLGDLTTVTPELVDEFIGIGELDSDEKRLSYLNQMSATPAENTVKANIQKFLQASKVGKKNRPVKPSTFGAVRLALSGLPFEGLDIQSFNESTVEQYKQWMNDSGLEEVTKKLRGKIFQRFVRYLWKHRLIEMPRNLDELTWESSPKAIQTYTVASVKKVLDTLPQRFKAWALLGLNCGMTNADIAEFRPDMIHGEYLTRKRVKTFASKGVPTVTYKLWPETIAALGKPASDDHWFLSSHGTPLKGARIEGTKEKLKDLVYLAWSRAEITLPLKAFRSISSTELEKDKVGGRYVIHFLGHSPQGLKDKSYAAPSQELFDELLDMLHNRFFGIRP